MGVFLRILRNSQEHLFTEHLHKCLNWTTKEFILQNIGGSHIKFHANIKAKGFRKKHIRRIFEKISRSSRPEVFCKKAVLTVLRNFTKFTGKLLCQSLFVNKVAGLRPATLLTKILGTGVFLWILRNL